MKVQATLRVINDVRTGVSMATGRGWKSQDVIVAWNEKLADGRDYENIQLVTLHGDQVDRFAQLNPQIGQLMTVDLAFSTRQFNGRVFNDNSLYV